MIFFKTFKYKEHPLTFSYKKLENISEDIVSLLKEWNVGWSDKVIIAYDKDVLVGFFRYDLGNTLPWLYAAGTYIIPEYRNRNIAFNLWQQAIINEKPNKILAYIASDGGLKLLNKIQKEFPNILYDYSISKKVLAA